MTKGTEQPFTNHEAEAYRVEVLEVLADTSWLTFEVKPPINLDPEARSSVGEFILASFSERIGDPYAGNGGHVHFTHTSADGGSTIGHAYLPQIESEYLGDATYALENAMSLVLNGTLRQASGSKN